MKINFEDFQSILIYDTETASFKVEDGIVEHAWLQVDSNLDILEEAYSRINPPGAISPGAAGVHGITKEMVKNEPTLDTFMKVVHKDKFSEQNVLLIAHNAVFDIKYFAPYCRNVMPLCTLKLVRHCFPLNENPELPDHKLPTLKYYFDLVDGMDSHSALGDVYTCYQLLRICMKKLGLDLQQVLELMSKPTLVNKLDFGKYKGKRLSDVPRDYINWLLRQDTLEDNLKYSIEIMLRR